MKINIKLPRCVWGFFLFFIFLGVFKLTSGGNVLRAFICKVTKYLHICKRLVVVDI